MEALMSFIYLASPYSHPNPQVMHARYLAVAAECAKLLKAQDWTYSPIVHCHELARMHGLPTDFEYWKRYNRAMLSSASAFYILTIPGWEQSRGVTAERAMAECAGLKTTLYSLTTTLKGDIHELLNTPA
jgi:hypothetical protein